MSSPLCLICIILLCSSGAAGSSLTIDTRILKHNGVIPKALNVTCAPVPSGTDNCANKILALQLERNGLPLATLQQNSNIFYDPLLATNIKAEGNIDKDVGKSQLTVHFENILVEDSGIYTCVMMYLDKRGLLHQDTASKNLTVESSNMYDVVRYFMTELDAMKQTPELQQEKLAEYKVELAEYKLELAEYKAELAEYKAEIAEHKAELAEHKVEIAEHEAELSEHKVEIAEHKLEIAEYKANLEECNVLLSEQGLELRELKSTTEHFIEKDNFTSAFVAGFPNGGSSNNLEILRFSDIKLNIGNDFDVSTSTYTAPVAGIYAFHLFVRIKVTDHRIHVSICVNDEEQARLNAYDAGKYDQSAVNTIVKLKSGDRVNCVVKDSPHNEQISEFPYTAFSGNLIRAF